MAFRVSNWLTKQQHDKKNLYGNAYQGDGWVSYSIGDGATNFTQTGAVAYGGTCASPIYQVAATVPPYAVYGDCFGGSGANSGSVISVKDDGSLDALIQNVTYGSPAGVHGTAISSDGKFIYGADDTGNAVWTHSIDSTTGELTYVADLTGPSEGSDPRHVAIHPNGTYLYTLLEGSNSVIAYEIDAATGTPSANNVTWPLKQAGEADADYWSDEVAVSLTAKYLWASSRAKSDNNTGYISAFTLNEAGAIVEQLFLLPTTTSGGAANAVTASPFSDRIVALTDSSVGFVEIWEMAEDGSSASIVAHLDVADGGMSGTKGGCCANAVWYS